MGNPFLERIKRGLGLAGPDLCGGTERLPTAELGAYFTHLGKADRSLPDAVIRYIADGSNASVLSALQGRAAREAWTQRPQYWPRRDEESVYANLAGWRIDQMQRLGEVLAALEPINHGWGYFGTKISPDWLRHTVTLWLGHERKGQPVQTLVELAARTENPIVSALDILFCFDGTNYGSRTSVSRFDGVAAWLDQSGDAIAAVAPALAADVRTALAAALGRLGLQDRFLDLLLDLASGSSKRARANARQALTSCAPDPLIAQLDARFVKAPPSQRAELVEIAAACLCGQGADLLACWRDGETAAKVLAALDQCGGAVKKAAFATASESEERADGPAGYRAVDGSWVDAGPPLTLSPPSPVPPDLLRTLEPAIAEFNRLLAEGKAASSNEQWHWSRQFQSKDGRDLAQLAQLAEGTRPMAQPSINALVDWLRLPSFKHPAVEAFFDDPRLSLHHLVRLGAAMSNCHIHGLFSDWGDPAGAAIQRRLAAGADFREFYALWVAAGGNDFLADHLTERWHHLLRELDMPFWQVLCGRFDQIDQALGMAPQSEAEQKRLLPGLDLLERFPKLPERYRNRLMLLSGDSSARIREKARALLQGAPGIDDTIAAQLKDGRQEVRALAAEWLAARQASDAVPRLSAALDREKSDVARAAMITALERLGANVSRYVDDAVLVEEAKAGLAKAQPKALDWFPFAMLPALQWADGRAVDPILPRWWVVLAAKLKQPGGNALINLWLDRLAPGHAHRLGWLILTGWIDEDTRRPTDEEANAHALRHVDATLRQNLAYAKQWPQGADYFPTDRNVLFAQLRQAKAGEYLGSAVDSKGVLALAARVHGADAAQRIRMFLKDHGSRVSQAKALLEVLASIGDSAALQLLLSAANRSKQRSVQAHAAALVGEIAERHGWSPSQLADRTIPTGGFDVDGTQDLELGEGRTYRLQLDAQDSVIIVNAEGREVKALPGPRVDQEKPAIDAAKKQLSSVRKEVKQVLAAQTDRLREAMLLQRHWGAAEWQSFVAGHPLVGRIAARLIWQGVDDAGLGLTLFRPLGDGSYTDVADDDVRPDGFARIRLAHSSLLSAADIAAARKHLADYRVESPFDQLGRDLPVLAEDRKRDRAISDREGWMIETFKLRGTATKLGYQRGPAQDGGWFITYEKTYRDAALVAQIEFSGAPLPEENRPAALQSLVFRKLRGGGGGGGQIALGDVPPVLLAECWRDLHDIADKGSGFDPDWQKKVY